MTDFDKELDRVLHSAKQDAPKPSQDLMARVLADAEAAQPVPKQTHQHTPARGPSLWQQIWGHLGGWPAMGGLATATCAGVWLGVYPTQQVLQATELVLGAQTVSPMIDVSPEGIFDITQEAL